jgi:hypothetical protein
MLGGLEPRLAWSLSVPASRRQPWLLVTGAALVVAPSAAAEVMDKEPGRLLIWGWSVLAAVIVYGLCRFRPWSAAVTLPLALSLSAAIALELADPFVGPAILAEEGWPYVASVVGATILIVSGHVAGLVAHRRRR